MKLVLGDCIEELKKLDDNSVDSIVTDPPYEIGFMGKKWDNTGIANSVEMWTEALRVLKPGGYLLSFSSARTYHRMTCAIEDAGFEIRDQIMWIYGCLDTETQVATSSGVKHYHETKIGDTVLCYDTLNNEYTYQPILEIVEYDYNDTAYRLIGDFGEQVVSRNHRCIIERNGNEVFNFAETLESEVHVPFLESLSELHSAVYDKQSITEPNDISDEWGTQGIRKWKGHKTSLVRVVSFQYTGKVWCLRVPTGAFVAVRNGVAFPTGNSGFPKSQNISKAIDKAAGAEREVIGKSNRHNSRPFGDGHGDADFGVFSGGVPDITAPATDDAKQWDGWGTALKPAHEPICVARKPLSEKTIIANVLKHGTGGINIDGCRVEYTTVGDGSLALNPHLRTHINGGNGGNIISHEEERRVVTPNLAGRFPANLIHDGSDEVIAKFPNNNAGCKPHTINASEETARINKEKGWRSCTVPKKDTFAGFDDGDNLSASRFFYSAKASKKDRGIGNIHPTVKPTDLMSYLCRLVTPPGGTVLDQFMGSGSTGKAAKKEGFHFIGIERDETYFNIATNRIYEVDTNEEIKPHESLQTESLFDMMDT